METDLLTVTGLSQRYGAIQALSKVSFSVHRGEVLGLIGPNSAGKTTLMAGVAGLDIPDGGTVRTSDGAPVRKTLFYLPDGVQIYPELQVADVLALFAAAFARQRGAVEQVTAALDLAAVKN